MEGGGSQIQTSWGTFFSLSFDIFQEKGWGADLNPNFLRNFCLLEMRPEKKFLKHVKSWAGNPKIYSDNYHGCVKSIFIFEWDSLFPWILKRGGLESSGRRLISSNGKTNRRVFFLLFFSSKFSDFLKKKSVFLRFFLRIWLDWRALVESHIPNIEKQRGFFFAEKKSFFSKISVFWRKKVIFWDFLRILIFFWHF